MELPTSGKSGGLHPQDCSPCSLATVFDLSRKGEESLLKTNAMDTLHLVKTPSWYKINPVTNKGPVFPENASDHTALPSEQIQPDDAFSNTTVTLSYVNRSHVFSSHDSLSQLNPRCGVSSINRKPSHHSSSIEMDTMLSEAATGGLCMAVGQGFLSHAGRPVGLAPDPTLFKTEEQAQLIESVTGTHLVQQAVEVNGKQVAWDADNIELSHGDSPKKCLPSQEKDKDVQNGMCSAPWNYRLQEGICSESLITGKEGVQKKCDSGVLLLISRTDDPVFLQDDRGPRNFSCHSLNGDYVSPLDDPLSPATTSVDDMEDVFILPQTLNSPSGENSFTDEATNTAGENPVEAEPSFDLSVTKSTITSVVGASSLTGSCSDKEDVIEKPISKNGMHTVQSTVPEPHAELSEMSDCVSGCKELISVTQKKVRTSDLLNGNVQEDGRRFERKKLPPRSRRGMRLEAIVQNITPSRYKVTSSTHSTKKHHSPKTQTNEMHSASVGQGIFNSVGGQNHKQKVDGPEKQPTVKSTSLQEDTDNIYPGHCNSKKSTSGSEHASSSKPRHCSVSPKPSKPPDSDVKETKNWRPCTSAKCSPRQSRTRALPVPKLCPKSPTKQLRASTSSKATHTAKKTHKAKRKRKKCKVGQSSMFSPKEPEIKLKYVNYKEEKRDKSDAFSPYIRLEVKEYSTCTVINYPEEESARLKKGQQQVCSFISGQVPSTSCLQLGRLSTESKRQSSLVCCLCGKSANYLDLGDLYGPYYPDNFKPALKAHLCLTGLKGDEDNSDSDSLCSTQDAKSSHTSGSWPPRPGYRLKREAVLGACRKWDSDSDCSHSPLAKKPRTESAAEDWYSPPVVPLDTSEYWVHEGCGIWTAGVFLVKGKLYGLEEAVRLAKGTVCSSCHAMGATLGCFFKGCPNKYHFACAVRSGCVLSEDNFSMKCTKHKNKSIRASSIGRQDNR